MQHPAPPRVPAQHIRGKCSPLGRHECRSAMSCNILRRQGCLHSTSGANAALWIVMSTGLPHHVTSHAAMGACNTYQQQMRPSELSQSADLLYAKNTSCWHGCSQLCVHSSSKCSRQQVTSPATSCATIAFQQ
eukprot:1161874-Pelagomonas_calceolata.AAC.3